MLYNVYNKYTSMDLEKFKDIRDKFESSYTIIITPIPRFTWNLPCSETQVPHL